MRYTTVLFTHDDPTKTYEKGDVGEITSDISEHGEVLVVYGDRRSGNVTSGVFKIYTHVTPRQPLHQTLDSVRTERLNQDNKWGEQNHNDLTWYSILMEEVGELAHAMNEARWQDVTGVASNLLDEIIQTAAVCAAWAQSIQRRENNDGQQDAE